MTLSLDDLRLLRRAVQIAAEDGSLYGGHEETDADERRRAEQIGGIIDRLDREIAKSIARDPRVPGPMKKGLATIEDSSVLVYPPTRIVGQTPAADSRLASAEAREFVRFMASRARSRPERVHSQGAST